LTEKSKAWLQDHCNCTAVTVIPNSISLPIPVVEPGGRAGRSAACVAASRAAWSAAEEDRRRAYRSRCRAKPGDGGGYARAGTKRGIASRGARWPRAEFNRARRRANRHRTAR
jgi:hypothetical protein